MSNRHLSIQSEYLKDLFGDYEKKVVAIQKKDRITRIRRVIKASLAFFLLFAIVIYTVGYLSSPNLEIEKIALLSRSKEDILTERSSNTFLFNAEEGLELCFAFSVKNFDLYQDGLCSLSFRVEFIHENGAIESVTTDRLVRNGKKPIEGSKLLINSKEKLALIFKGFNEKKIFGFIAKDFGDSLKQPGKMTLKVIVHDHFKDQKAEASIVCSTLLRSETPRNFNNYRIICT